MSLVRRSKRAATRPPTAQVPHWPQKCSVIGCENDTTVAMLQVRDDRGRILTNAASVFLEMTAQCQPVEDASGCWLLRQGFEFVGWVTRCASCYDREVQSSGRSQMCIAEVLEKLTS